MQAGTVYICPRKCYNAKKAQRKVIYLHRFIALILALALFLPAGYAQDKYTAFPEALRMTQKREKTTLTETSYVMTYYPKTISKDVDNALKSAIDALVADNMPHLPRKAALKNESAMLDTGATVYRTGDKWASFLIVSTVLNGASQLRMTFDTCVYDMHSGKALTLSDVLVPDALSLVQQEAQRQLNAYFPQFEADVDALSALCAQENLLSAHFTLSPAFLQLHFPSEALYPHSGTIMHVRIPYTQLQQYLTDEAKLQTDNSRYKLVALTYDDGPTRRRTLSILRSLRGGGVNATFFVVGDRIPGAEDLISLEHNAGFAVASHNYEHVYTADMEGKVRMYRDMLNEKLHAITGRSVNMMRAPGGHEEIYIKEQVDLPLIHWSLASKDGKSADFEPSGEAVRLVYSMQDGSIVLMHDLRAISADYTAFLPQLLNDRGFMCVTVEELFALRGIPLENNTVYLNAPPVP